MLKVCRLDRISSRSLRRVSKPIKSSDMWLDWPSAHYTIWLFATNRLCTSSYSFLCFQILEYDQSETPPTGLIVSCVVRDTSDRFDWVLSRSLEAHRKQQLCPMVVPCEWKCDVRHVPTTSCDGTTQSDAWQSWEPCNHGRSHKCQIFTTGLACDMIVLQLRTYVGMLIGLSIIMTT